jgi:hypothetical protein
MEGEVNGCYDVLNYQKEPAGRPDNPCQYWVNKLIWLKL